MRLRGGLIEGGFGQNNVRAVFTDIRQRAATLLAAELKTAKVDDVVGAEMNRILRRLLDFRRGYVRRAVTSARVAPSINRPTIPVESGCGG